MATCGIISSEIEDGDTDKEEEPMTGAEIVLSIILILVVGNILFISLSERFK